MKKIQTTLLLLSVSSILSTHTIMLIHTKNGDKATRVMLVDKPVATYEGNELVLTSSSFFSSFFL